MGLCLLIYQKYKRGYNFGHGVVEYSQENFEKEDYQKWAKEDKTFIILNGGTSNHSVNRYHFDGEEFLGTMEQHIKELKDSGIIVSSFYEPDLNDMLSAIVFLVDERVFNKEDYPDFIEPRPFGRLKTPEEVEHFNDERDKMYFKWMKSLGENGEQVAFLKKFLKRFRLA